MRDLITPLEAFNAMTAFLDLLYIKTKSDDVGSLLGDMSFISDGMTVDPTAWNDWVFIVNSYTHLDFKNSFIAMKQYLKNYAYRASSKDINQWLNALNVENQNLWSLWTSCIDEVLNQKDAKRYLEIKN